MPERETGRGQAGSEFKAPDSKRPIKVIKANKAPEVGGASHETLDLKYEDMKEVSNPGDEKKDVFLGHEPSGVESLRLEVRQKKEYKGSATERKDTLEQIDKLFGKAE